MAHARTAIRQAVIAAVTGLTTTGANVTEWSLYAQGEDILPSLDVMVAQQAETVSESADNELGPIEVRDLPVVIEGRAKRAVSGTHSSLLDTIDGICFEVESVMTLPASVTAGLIDDSRLDSTEIEMTGDGEYPVVKVTMNWLIRYSVDRTNPS